MKNNSKIVTATGIILFHYNFENKDGKKIETTKVLFNILGLPIYINSKLFNNEQVGNKITIDLGFDGKGFYPILDK